MIAKEILFFLNYGMKRFPHQLILTIRSSRNRSIQNIAYVNPIPTEGGPFGPEQPETVWHLHSFMAGVTKIHDFVYHTICLV